MSYKNDAQTLPQYGEIQSDQFPVIPEYECNVRYEKIWDTEVPNSHISINEIANIARMIA